MIVFDIGQEYANRKGKYTILEINDPKMTVEYEDGSTADLSISIQQRIWENIVTEEEAELARTSTKRKKRTAFFNIQLIRISNPRFSCMRLVSEKLYLIF